MTSVRVVPDGLGKLDGADLPLTLARYWRAEATALRREATECDRKVEVLEREAGAILAALGVRG